MSPARQTLGEWIATLVLAWPCGWAVAAPGPSVEKAESHAPVASSDKMVQVLERSVERDPHNPRLQYNLGTRRYLQGNYEPAASALGQALAFARGRMQARAAYNLGNARFRQGQEKETSAAEEAARLYGQALEQYRAAIRQDPHDEDARFNYELTQRRLAALKEQQQKTKSSQGEQGQPQQSDQSAAQQQQAGGQAQQEQAQRAEAQQAESGQEKQEHAQAQPSQGQDDQRREGQQAGQPDQGPSTEQAKTRAPDQAAGQMMTPSDQQSHGQAGSSVSQGHDLSNQEALWILESVKREEQAAAVHRQGKPAQESEAEQDW